MLRRHHETTAEQESITNSDQDEDDDHASFLDDDRFIQHALTGLCVKPLVRGIQWWGTGAIAASFVSWLFGLPLAGKIWRLEAIFILGPLGVARGVVREVRCILIDSGVTQMIGRNVYSKAMKCVRSKKSKSTNLREALQEIRHSHPLFDRLLTGRGFVGSVGRKILTFYLPDVQKIFIRLDSAMAKADEKGRSMDDSEIVGSALQDLIDVTLDYQKYVITRFGVAVFGSFACSALLMSNYWNRVLGNSE